MHIRRVGNLRCQVGEGPLWDERAAVLYFVDLVGKRLWRLDPSTEALEHWELPQPVAALALREDGAVLLALADGFYDFDLATHALTPIARPPLAVGTQFNDGKVDRSGRFVAITMNAGMKDASAALYRLAFGHVETLDEGYVIANGPCWSIDGRTFYCADSIPQKIYAYDYDPGEGKPANRRLFANTSDLGGIPDGATVDAQGRVWSAICGGGKIAVYSSAGALDRLIEMPTRWVSSVMFGGPKLDRLYVSSLDPTLVGLPADEGAGYLYVIEDIGARGVVEPRVRG